MRAQHRIVGPAIALLFVAGPARAQQSRLIDVPGLGSLSFPSSVRSDSANRTFHRGLLLLHVFHYDEAAAAFREVQRIEPGFALAYWGEAMTHNHAVWNQQDLAAGRTALARLAPDPASRERLAGTPRERAWLRTVETLYGDGGKARRDTLYEHAMQRLVDEYPDDEARLFLALALLGLNQGVRDSASYRAAAEIAGDVLSRNPRHPGASHYFIHAVDDPEHAALGLHAAELLAAAAPDAGHAQHMTSHIFVALGMWNEGVAANERALGVAAEAARRTGGRINRCGHYNSWLAYGYLQQGRVHDATRLVEACRDQAVSASPPADPTETDPDASPIASFFAMRTRLIIDGEGWATDAVHWPVDPGSAPAPRITWAFATGLMAARSGDADRLAAATRDFQRARHDLETAAAASTAADPGAAEFGKRLDVLDLELQGLGAAAAGRDEDEIRLLHNAAAAEDAMAYAFGPPFVDKPAWELLGEELLRLNRAADAGSAFMTAIKHNPGRTSSLIGLARSETRLGNRQAASDSWSRLLAIWHAADPDFAPAIEARAARTGS
jgi:tetratricopeptide (TPR) repeat protein